MNRAELFKFHEEICSRALEIMRKKNHDYAPDDDNPFANFMATEASGICNTDTGFLVRLSDKLSRIATATRHELAVEDESEMDTTLDSINYLILFAAYRQMKKNKIHARI